MHPTASQTAIAALFIHQAELDSFQIEDGHVVTVNGRGPAEFEGESHQPGIRPPSAECWAADMLADIVAKWPTDFVGRSLSATRDARFPSLVRCVETVHGE